MNSNKIFWALLLLSSTTCTHAIAQDGAVIGFSSLAVTDTVCGTLYDNGNSVRFILWLSNAVNPDFDASGAKDVRHVAGFELKLAMSPEVEIVSIEYPISAINTGSGQDYIVQYAVPRSVFANQTLILAEIHVAQKDGNEWPHDGCQSEENLLIVSPADGATLSGEVSFIDANDPDDPFVIATPGLSFYLAGYAFVANDVKSWGSIKSLYR